MTNDEIVARALSQTEVCSSYLLRAQHVLTALSSAGRLVGDATFDPETRGTNVGSLPPLTAAQGGSISVTRIALAAAPHPAPDATSDLVHYGVHITQDGKRIAPEDFYAAPDATDWKARCEAAEEWKRKQAGDIVKLGRMFGMEVMRAELMERERDAAQAENRQLRAELAQCRKSAEVTEISHDGLLDENEKLRRALDAAAMYARARSECYASSPMGTYVEGHKDASSILLTQIEALIAALSPPPLSPEKP